MKKTLFILSSIVLFSCNSNNKSENNQTDIITDSLTAEDTLVIPPSEEIISDEPANKTNDPIVGSFYCQRSGDIYTFNDDFTGMFTPNCGIGATFNWHKSGSTLTVTYTGESEYLGSTRLNYDSKSNSFIEKSMSYGNLKFTKQ